MRSFLNCPKPLKAEEMPDGKKCHQPASFGVKFNHDMAVL